MAETVKCPPSTARCPLYLTGTSEIDGNPVIKVTNRPPQFGIFFDGTGNNLDNDARDPYDDKEPTNIAKLYLLYQRMPQAFVDATYIPGIGTERGKDDSNLDMAFALTFRNRLLEGTTRARDFFRKFAKSPVGIIDVFGFSRGAAAARAFVNEVQRINSAEPQFWGGPQLVIRFLGIFDTVGSIDMPGNENNDPYVLDLHPKAVEHVYHLTARHEQRENFPLSSILMAPGSPPWSTFVEEEIPGAHSDVGGGYGAVPQVLHFPPEQIYWLSRAQREDEIRKLKQRYEQRYYQPGIDLTMRVSYDAQNGPPGSPYRRSLVAPQWTRHVRPQLAHSALQKMHARAVSKGVPFEPLDRLMQQPAFAGRANEDVYELPSDLRTLLSGNGTPDELYKRYIHHSHQHYAGGLVNPNAPEGNPEKAAPNGRREVFFNKTARAYSPRDQWKKTVKLTGNGIEHTEWVRK